MTQEELDIKFMKMALDEAAAASAQDEIPVGAVVVCKGMVIARAHNLTETLTDVTAHAEMQAITAAASYLGGKYLDQCTLYVTLEPCVMCAGAIGWSQLQRLVYGASDPKRGYTIYAPNALHPKTQVTSGILADECSQILQDYFKSKRYYSFNDTIGTYPCVIFDTGIRSYCVIGLCDICLPPHHPACSGSWCSGTDGFFPIPPRVLRRSRVRLYACSCCSGNRLST